MLSKNGIILLPSSWIILATFSPKLSDGNTTGWFLVDLKSWVIISPISWHFPLNSLLYSHELLNFQTETSFSDIYFVWSFGPCFSGGEGIVEYHFFPLKLPYSLALKTLFLNLLPLHLPPDPLISSSETSLESSLFSLSHTVALKSVCPICAPLCSWEPLTWSTFLVSPCFSLGFTRSCLCLCGSETCTDLSFEG